MDENETDLQEAIKLTDDIISGNITDEEETDEIIQLRARQKALKKIQEDQKARTKRIVPRVLIGAAIATGLLTGLALNKDKIKYNHAIDVLDNEVEMHGGKINLDTGKPLNTVEEIKKHVDTGHCKISEGNTFDERIDNYCEKNNLPSYIADLEKIKLEYYFNNEQGKANAINVKKIAKTLRKMPNVSYFPLDNDDGIIIEDGKVYYRESSNNTYGGMKM